MITKKISFSFLLAASLLLFFSCERDYNNPWDGKASIDPNSWAPQNLAIEDVSITEKKLTWAYTGDNRFEGFKLDRKAGNAEWQESYQVLPKETRNWTDSQVTPDPSLTYSYRVYAFAGKYNSAEKTSSVAIEFPAPANVQIEKLTDKSYKLNWSDNSTGEQGFKIDRKIDEGNWVVAFGNVPANQTSFTDTNVFRAVNVEYRVYAFFESHESLKVTLATSAELTAPSNLQVKPNTINSVTLSWLDNSTVEEGFKLDRRVNSGEWELIYASVGNNQTTYFDNSLDWQTNVYTYRISAYFGQYNSATTQSSISWPQVTTSEASNIWGTSVTSGGNITIQGNYSIIAKGICYSTTPNPAISGPHTVNGSGASFFACSITGLIPITSYYVRAYATTDYGIVYGMNKNFITNSVGIGESFAGGIVFYLNGNGGGLVCAPTNQSTGAKWGCGGTTIGGTSTTVGAGNSNTAKIMAGCSTSGIAARICNDLVLNGYNDWFLPSKDELNLMYQNLKMTGIGGFASTYYWSSSECDNGYAWLQFFSNGYQNYVNKFSDVYVRAVRAF